MPGAPPTFWNSRSRASREAVWDALTSKIGDWWPQEFFAGGEAGSRSFALDATPGGHMTERWDGGGGLLWGTVVTVRPGRQLQLTAVSFPEWGGPATTLLSYDLEDAGEGTSLRFAESTLGRVSDDTQSEKDKGWRFLYDGVMRAFVEGGVPPAWEG